MTERRKTCLFCDKPIEQTEGRRERKFCAKSDCGTRYWIKNHPPKKDTIKKVILVPDENGQWQTKDGKKVKLVWAEATTESFDGKKTTLPSTNPTNVVEDEKNVDVVGNNIPPMPVREKGEDAFAFAERKNLWKQQYGK